MTTSIEHSMPSDLVIADRSLFGGYRPGNIISKSENGLRRSRSYADHNLAAYSLQLDPKNYTEAAYEEMMALMNATAINAIPFWIKEPILKPRIAVPGELTDGTLTTFINPLNTASVEVLIGGGIDQNSAGMQMHTAANLLTDAQANAAGGALTGLDAYGTTSISVTRGVALDGQYSIRVVNTTGAQANVGINTNDAADRPAVTASRDYTIQASFMPSNAAHTYRVEGQYRTSGGATTGSAFNDEGTGALGEWIHLRATATSPADAASLEIRAYRTTSATGTFGIACLGVAPGDFGRWFLPSLTPRLIEWDSAPTANKRLTFSSPTCKRWTRVALDRDRQSASVELLGNVSVERMSLREVLFP